MPVGSMMKCDRTYRFNAGDAASFQAIERFIRGLKKRDATWTIYQSNCSWAVAQALIAGGRTPPTNFGKRWTPNRLEKWCKTIVKSEGGEKKHPDIGFVKPYAHTL